LIPRTTGRWRTAPRPAAKSKNGKSDSSQASLRIDDQQSVKDETDGKGFNGAVE
jgi:hypothetical protein